MAQKLIDAYINYIASIHFQREKLYIDFNSIVTHLKGIIINDTNIETVKDFKRQYKEVQKQLKALKLKEEDAQFEMDKLIQLKNKHNIAVQKYLQLKPADNTWSVLDAKSLIEVYRLYQFITNTKVKFKQLKSSFLLMLTTNADVIKTIKIDIPKDNVINEINEAYNDYLKKKTLANMEKIKTDTTKITLLEELNLNDINEKIQNKILELKKTTSENRSEVKTTSENQNKRIKLTDNNTDNDSMETDA